MKSGPLKPGSASAIKYDSWVKIYETTLAATASSITISGLTGDTDKEYKLEARIVNGYAGSIGIKVRPNNDTGSNYGYQYLDGTDTTASAGRGATTSVQLCGANQNGVGQGEMVIQSKSGFVRTFINEETAAVTTTVSNVTSDGYSWNNTADEITSMVVLADQTGGLGVGSNITLWKRAYAT